MPNGWRTIKSLVHKSRPHGRRGKGMAESFSREKLRHAPQEEGRGEILCDLPPVWPRLVRPTNLMSRMNGNKTHTHTHTYCCTTVYTVHDSMQSCGIKFCTFCRTWWYHFCCSPTRRGAPLSDVWKAESPTKRLCFPWSVNALARLLKDIHRRGYTRTWPLPRWT